MMENIKYNFYGCAVILLFLAVLFLGGVYLANSALGHLVDYAGVRATVDIATLGVQRDITIGCMQYSWVTPTPACMLLGGVNGFSWARWGLLGVAFGCGFLWHKGVRNGG